MHNAGSKGDQISIMRWRQKENVLVQIIVLVTKSLLDHVWGYLTISIFMEWNKVCFPRENKRDVDPFPMEEMRRSSLPPWRK
jgi:hypothetical protein